MTPSILSKLAVLSIATAALAQTQPVAGLVTATSTTRPTTSDAPTSRPSTPQPYVAPPTVPITPPTADFSAKYAVVAERNMFLRERVRRNADGANSRPASNGSSASQQTLEELLVLRGIVLEDDLFRAYFENSRTGEVVRVAAGDSLARGHVVDISIDALNFEAERGPVWINIGDNLVGAHVASTGARPSGGPATSSAGGTGDTGNLSVEERMRQRRQQSNGGAPR